MSTVTLTLDEIESTCKAVLVKHGAADSVAAQMAHAIRVAESKGNLICGLYYLQSYCIQLESGRVSGTVDPIVTQPKTGIVKVDAGFGFAQPAFAKGLPVALDAIKDAGTVSLAICHSHTCTSLGYFTEAIAKAGMIGIGFTNASAVVSPPNGNKAVLGTNPMAMAIPRKDGKIAFQFDQSTSAVALGKITMAKAAGESIPLGWAVDADGNPTTDPEAALKGSLVSSGGYKGFGFGLMVEVLAAAVTGSVASTDVKGLKLADGPPHNLGQYYLIIDPTAVSGDTFHDRIAALATTVSSQEGARLPGTQWVEPSSVTIESSVWELTQSLA